MVVLWTAKFGTGSGGHRKKLKFGTGSAGSSGEIKTKNGLKNSQINLTLGNIFCFFDTFFRFSGNKMQVILLKQTALD